MFTNRRTINALLNGECWVFSNERSLNYGLAMASLQLTDSTPFISEAPRANTIQSKQLNECPKRCGKYFKKNGKPFNKHIEICRFNE